MFWRRGGWREQKGGKGKRVNASWRLRRAPTAPAAAAARPYAPPPPRALRARTLAAAPLRLKRVGREALHVATAAQRQQAGLVRDEVLLPQLRCRGAAAGGGALRPDLRRRRRGRKSFASERPAGARADDAYRALC
jgi:hypothetical protein